LFTCAVYGFRASCLTSPPRDRMTAATGDNGVRLAALTCVHAGRRSPKQFSTALVFF
jgi:hypothetical protein